MEGGAHCCSQPLITSCDIFSSGEDSTVWGRGGARVSVSVTHGKQISRRRKKKKKAVAQLFYNEEPMWE